LLHLLELVLATAIGWEVIRYFTPAEIPVRLAPVLVVIIGFGFTFLDSKFLLAISAAGGVALFHYVTGPTSLKPLKIRVPKRFRRKRTSRTTAALRIPEL
jgi:hypothetical protein